MPWTAQSMPMIEHRFSTSLTISIFLLKHNLPQYWSVEHITFERLNSDVGCTAAVFMNKEELKFAYCRCQKLQCSSLANEDGVEDDPKHWLLCYGTPFSAFKQS
ncbi:hypothetical protein Csa_000580 [Cucumis sativus]|uniref:Uncharacterized protein n=1 Tax=Cucumis sativus TaxID=3659 RepID=A0A0A0KJE3_CUCSA|nr:hypothetical protein Csa_000580 [Cucumis sativus]